MARTIKTGRLYQLCQKEEEYANQNRSKAKPERIMYSKYQGFEEKIISYVHSFLGLEDLREEMQLNVYDYQNSAYKKKTMKGKGF